MADPDVVGSLIERAPLLPAFTFLALSACCQLWPHALTSLLSEWGVCGDLQLIRVDPRDKVDQRDVWRERLATFLYKAGRMYLGFVILYLLAIRHAWLAASFSIFWLLMVELLYRNSRNRHRDFVRLWVAGCFFVYPCRAGLSWLSTEFMSMPAGLPVLPVLVLSGNGASINESVPLHLSGMLRLNALVFAIYPLSSDVSLAATIATVLSTVILSVKLTLIERRVMKDAPPLTGSQREAARNTSSGRGPGSISSGAMSLASTDSTKGQACGTPLEQATFELQKAVKSVDSDSLLPMLDLFCLVSYTIWICSEAEGAQLVGQLILEACRQFAAVGF